jgi:hypothetical protein
MKMFAEIIKVSHRMAVENGEIYDFDSKIYKWLRDTKQIKMSQTDVNDAMRYGQAKFTKLYGLSTNQNNVNKEESIKKYGRENVVAKYFMTEPLSKILANLDINYFK